MFISCPVKFVVTDYVDRIYRAKILFALEKDLLEELEWLNGVSLTYLKNYQIWYVQLIFPHIKKHQLYHSNTNTGHRHHRQVLMSSTAHFPTLPQKEPAFLMEMFAQDSKNYHVWTYRHWLVRHFKLWDHPVELADVESLIDADVRNNSAWNHRFMLRFGPRDDQPAAGMSNGDAPGSEKGRMAVVDEDVVDGELGYAKAKIVRAPENRSPWAYARGVLRAADRGLEEWREFAGKFVVVKEDGEVVVKSTHALEWLADVYAQESKEEAVRMLTLLKEKYDPIRTNYWDYRIQMISSAA